MKTSFSKIATILLLASVTAITAEARPKYPPLPANSPIQAIDVGGDAYLVRDGANASIVLVDKVADKIAAYVKPQPGSQIQCGDGYCAIGQLDRRGTFKNFEGQFAKTAHFPTFARNWLKPTSLSEQGWFETFAGDAFAYADQCQNPVDLKTAGNLVVNVTGIAAEQLFNYLATPKVSGQRVTATEKSAAGQSFYCERMPQWAPEDIDVTKGNAPLGNPSHIEYMCEFKFSNSGHLMKRTGCAIYGATSSAGGGGK